MGIIVQGGKTVIGTRRPSGAPTLNPIWDTLTHAYNADNNSLDQKGTSNGTLVGGTTYVSGVIGQAFQGDGINDCVTFADNSWDVTTDFTMSIWFKEGLDTIDSFPVCCYDGTYGFYIYNHSGTYRVVYGTFANAIIIGSGSFVSVKHHVICTLVGTTFKIYLDGGLISTQTLSVIVSSTMKCGLLYQPVSNSLFYNGWVDDILFFSSGLDSTQVTELYNSGNGKQYPN